MSLRKYTLSFIIVALIGVPSLEAKKSKSGKSSKTITQSTGPVFGGAVTSLSSRFNNISGATFTGEAQITGKLLADGATFEKSLTIDVSTQPFSNSEPDALIKNSTIKNNITAKVRKIVFENSSAKTVTITAIKDDAGNDLPCLVEIKGSTSLQSLTFENGKGIVFLSGKAKAPHLTGGRVISAQELVSFVETLQRSEQEKKNAKRAELEQKKAADEKRIEEIKTEYPLLIKKIQAEAQKAFNSIAQWDRRGQENLKKALDAVDEEGIVQIIRPSSNFPRFSNPMHDDPHTTLKKYPELYKLLEKLADLETEDYYIAQREKQLQEFEKNN